MTDLALVTGATGFVGSAICQALLDAGLRVRALHRPSSNLRLLQDLPIEKFVGDILDRPRMEEACQGVRWVFHAASESAYWRNPLAVQKSAVSGTSNLLHAALETGVERFIFTSSLSAMGIPEKNELLTEAHEFNLSPEMFPYGAAKYAAEKIVREKVAQGLDAVILNPSLVLGPGDLNQITGSMVVEAARGWGFFYVSGGANYVHISDVARGHVAAALHGEKGQRYILGGENISHKDAFTTLTEIVGRRPPWLHIPDWLVRVGARALKLLPRFPFLPFDANQLRLSQNHIYCAIHPARQALGLGEPLSFRQAAQDAYEWYLQAGIIKPTT